MAWDLLSHLSLEDQNQGRRNTGQVSQRPCLHCPPSVGLPLLFPSDLAKMRHCLQARSLLKAASPRASGVQDFPWQVWCHPQKTCCGAGTSNKRTLILTNLDEAYWRSGNLITEVPVLHRTESMPKNLTVDSGKFR